MAFFRGVLAFSFVALNLVTWFTWLAVLTLGRLIASPWPALRFKLTGAMDQVIDGWCWGNRLMISVLSLSDIDVTWNNPEELRRDRWYLVVSNHQTWVDIFVLQTQLVDRIPPLKFFTKKQLIWVPFLGLAMWLLDFPYVNRYSRAQIARDPSLRERDRENVRRACRAVTVRPTCILNFLEGTRFTYQKHERTQSPYVHLLPPRAGGLAVVLDSLKEELSAAVDVTITYPRGVPSFWDFLCGRCPRIEMVVSPVALPDLADANPDAADAERDRVIGWVNALWDAKDRTIAERIVRPTAHPSP
ncbi:MAG: acetyltransferase [Pseudomonadota bacterium]